MLGSPRGPAVFVTICRPPAPLPAQNCFTTQHFFRRITVINSFRRSGQQPPFLIIGYFVESQVHIFVNHHHHHQHHTPSLSSSSSPSAPSTSPPTRNRFETCRRVSSPTSCLKKRTWRCPARRLARRRRSRGGDIL